MSGVQSIERAFALLRVLAVGPAGITELADRADLPKSTVSRLVSALEQEGVVEQVEAGGDYRLGPTLADLAGLAAPGPALLTAARPHLTELTARTGETSGLAILDGMAVHYLDHVESPEQVTARGWTGDTFPPHVVPSGLVLLTGVETAELDDYLAGDLVRNTDRTVVDPARVRSRVAEVAEAGFIWVEREFDDELSSVAAPVIGDDDAVIAALHIHGPSYRFPGDTDPHEIGELVRDAADQLSAQLRVRL